MLRHSWLVSMVSVLSEQLFVSTSGHLRANRSTVCRRPAFCALSVEGVLIQVCAEAEQYPTPQHEDGSAPTQAVTPVKLMVGLKDFPINELDGVEDQCTSLQDHCNQAKKKKTKNYYGCLIQSFWYLSSFYLRKKQPGKHNEIHFYTVRFMPKATSE